MLLACFRLCFSFFRLAKVVGDLEPQRLDLFFEGAHLEEDDKALSHYGVKARGTVYARLRPTASKPLEAYFLYSGCDGPNPANMVSCNVHFQVCTRTKTVSHHRFESVGFRIHS